MATESMTDGTAGEWLLLHEAAVVMRGSVSTLRRRIAEGELPASRVGGKLLVRRADLDRFIESRRVQPQEVAA